MDKMQNFVVGYVVTAPDPATTGTSLTVSNGSLFPDPTTFGAYNLVCWSMDNIQTPANCEIVRVTAKTTSGANAVLTITRGQESTSGLSIATDWKVYLSPTQKYFDDLSSQTIHGDTIYGGTNVTNLNTIDKSGFYTCYGTATGVPSASYSWFVLHQNSNAGTVSATQRAVALDSTPIIYERVKTSSTWGSWTLVSPAITAPQAVTITSGAGTVVTRPTEAHYLNFTASISEETALASTMSNGDAYAIDVTFSGAYTVTFTGVTEEDGTTAFAYTGANAETKTLFVRRTGSRYIGIQ